MENDTKPEIVPDKKALINQIVLSDDIKKAAKRLKKPTYFIYNVLADINKRDEDVVMKSLVKVIEARHLKEQKILAEIRA